MSKETKEPTVESKDLAQDVAYLTEVNEDLVKKNKELEESINALQRVNHDLSKLLNRYAMALLGLTEKFSATL